MFYFKICKQFHISHNLIVISHKHRSKILYFIAFFAIAPALAYDSIREKYEVECYENNHKCNNYDVKYPTYDTNHQDEHESLLLKKDYLYNDHFNEIKQDTKGEINTNQNYLIEIYDHMERVLILVRAISKIFNCQPSSVKGLVDAEIFEDNNTCGRVALFNTESYFPVFLKNHKIKDNVILLDDIKLGITGEIKMIKRNLIYIIHGLNEEEAKKIYHYCVIHEKKRGRFYNPRIIRNAEVVDANNICGMTKSNNPLIYIGK